MNTQTSKKQQSLTVEDSQVYCMTRKGRDYMSLTDMARSQGDVKLVNQWLGKRGTIEFLATWETLNNPNFDPTIMLMNLSDPDITQFAMTPRKWIRSVNAAGLRIKSGENKGAYAHPDIAFEFASWLGPEFKLHLLTQFKLFKEKENGPEQVEWNVLRGLSKTNYRLHTSAIKENLIRPELSKDECVSIYKTEADIINMAIFGKTAQQWRDETECPNENIRDHASPKQLVILSNLESINAALIRQGMDKLQRVHELQRVAASQMKLL